MASCVAMLEKAARNYPPIIASIISSFVKSMLFQQESVYLQCQILFRSLFFMPAFPQFDRLKTADAKTIRKALFGLNHLLLKSIIQHIDEMDESDIFLSTDNILQGRRWPRFTLMLFG